MVIARTLQALGLLALLAAAVVASNAAPESETQEARAARLYCDAMRLSEPFVARNERRAPQPMPACAPAPRLVWDRDALTLAGGAALGGLLLLGFGQLLVNTGRRHD